MFNNNKYLQQHGMTIISANTHFKVVIIEVFGMMKARNQLITTFRRPYSHRSHRQYRVKGAAQQQPRYAIV